MPANVNVNKGSCYCAVENNQCRHFSGRERVRKSVLKSSKKMMIIITYRKKECTWERGKVGFKIFDVNKTR